MSQAANRLATPDNYLLYWRNRKKLSLRMVAARLEASGKTYASPNTINR